VDELLIARPGWLDWSWALSVVDQEVRVAGEEVRPADGVIVKGLTAELKDHPVTAVGVTPGWLRSEKMLENFGVTENTWRDACVKTPGFGISESPTYVARGVAALAQPTAGLARSSAPAS